MKLQESKLLPKVIEVFPATIGKVFLFSDIVMVEPNEGVHLCYKNTRDIYRKIKSFYGSKKIGLISNRINDYSLEVLDYDKLFGLLPNLKAYSVIYYTLKSAYNIEIEKLFTKVPLMSYDEIQTAYENTIAYLSNKNYRKTS